MIGRSLKTCHVHAKGVLLWEESEKDEVRFRLVDPTASKRGLLHHPTQSYGQSHISLISGEHRHGKVIFTHRGSLNTYTASSGSVPLMRAATALIRRKLFSCRARKHGERTEAYSLAVCGRETAARACVYRE